MKTIVLHDSTIYIGAGLLSEMSSLVDFGRYSRAFIVTDRNIKPLYLKQVVAAIPATSTYVALAPGEPAKNLRIAERLWNAMHKFGCDRKSVVVNLGGGVVGDLGGFVASTYMRGVDCINIPTTLLAQVDASIGGKTAVDFAGVKNLIGTFKQPVSVIIDTKTLATLRARELRSGFAEIIKHGLIADASYFKSVTAKRPEAYTPEELIDIVGASCRIKAAIVEDDESEQGARKLLNFGHTIGHAVESACLDTPSPLLHGEAISVGMLAEAYISYKLNKISKAELQTIEKVLKDAGLPVSVETPQENDILTLMRSDKKNERGVIYFTLLEGIGHAMYNQEVSPSLVSDALQRVLR